MKQIKSIGTLVTDMVNDHRTKVSREPKFLYPMLPNIITSSGSYLNNFKISDTDIQLFKKMQYIYISDHMPASYDFKIDIDHKTEYSKNSYVDFLSSIDVNPDEKIFLTDHYTCLDSLSFVLSDINNHCFLGEVVNFLKEFSDCSEIPDIIPTKKFTFMSNKPRPHRMLASLMCANLFNSNDLSYTFIESDIQDTVASELLINTDYKLSIKFLNQRWVEANNSDQSNESGLVSVYQHIKKELFYNSTTSIIIEPAFYEKGNGFTEKTIMPIYSGHFLLWPGMYKSAETFKSLGFDVFDDIIDHSYQYLEHPGKRVVEAFLRNYDFLNNIELQYSYRKQFKDRLNYNLSLLRNPIQLAQSITNLQVGSSPMNYELETKKLYQYLNTL